MDMKEVAKFDQQVGTLKLSDAIRIGAKIRPQCFGELFAQGGSCALGAAIEGANIFTSTPLSSLMDRFNVPENIMLRVEWKNDRERQTREQIADWLQAQGF